MKSSTYLSLGLLLAVVVWMLSGATAGAPETEIAREEPRNTLQKMKVRVIDAIAEEITREIVVQGELEPLRQVEIRSQTTSRVIGLPMPKGAYGYAAGPAGRRGSDSSPKPR